ncbi:olfactory receptor family 2 subfamily AT member 4 [Phyllostomus discolor]|uniref:Olfactory receptor n=1 Tax=Phyllostomus discolor TaxID=89673 RepID=A0A6J2LXH1_9CHIR|nr:olfactory receptor 2AT4-like [Phyllostomus discolor]KAF6105237.1 olfactory receptor family 2 subfamily AT member 4 [Phyllostomus discolor]
MDATACNGSRDSSPIFYLVGIPSLQEFLFLPVFFIFLFFYLLILVGNTLILVAVVAEPSLHKPMYFFLINLSALDILLTTTIVPKMLSLLLLGDRFLSFPACFLQMYLFHGLGCCEAFILVVMAYDRYVAICRPLHYPVHMTPQTNAALAASAWLAALLLPIPAVVQTSHMAFGSVAHVYHCFCDHLAVVQASCSDTTPQTFMGFCIAMVVSFLPLLLVLLSYAHILASVLRISSQEGRSKAFSTCSSHLLVVGTYYSSIAISYVSYRADLPLDFHIMGNVVYAILTPVLNPLIYTLRNKDVKAAITKMACPQGPGHSGDL